MTHQVNRGQSETKEKSADKTILSEQERLIERGRARIAYLDRILRAKQAEEKKVKREGRELRRYLQMQLMELIEAPTQGECTKLNGAFSSTEIVPKPNATSELTFCRPRQEVLDNFERFLALDTVPSIASNGTGKFSKFFTVSRPPCSSLYVITGCSPQWFSLKGPNPWSRKVMLKPGKARC
ncbi:unnamed protein product [Dicrocoelium dendriticum]|nr:unnamed protein product [Dicrocoelium dendriticum]